MAKSPEKEISDQLNRIPLFLERRQFEPSVNDLVVFLKHSLERSPFLSEKAIFEWLLSRDAEFFPPEILINRSIIPVIGNWDIEDDFYSAAMSAINAGEHWGGIEPGCRTAFESQPDKSPWVMGLNRESLETFIQDSFVTWLNIPHLSELILMENPAGLGQIKLREEHMVCRTEYRSSLNTLYFELQLGTDQLRELDKIDAADRISGEFVFFDLGLIEKININFGKNHTDRGVEQQVILDFRAEPIEPNGCFFSLLENMLIFFRNSLSKNAIKNESYEIVRDFISKLLSYWYEYGLQRRFEALDEIGLPMVEFQGRMGESGLDWLLIYGLRGDEDERDNWARQFKSY